MNNLGHRVFLLKRTLSFLQRKPAMTKLEQKSLKLFTQETLDKCKLISCVRKRLSLKHGLYTIPNTPDVIHGYHSTCYRQYTAIKKK